MPCSCSNAGYKEGHSRSGVPCWGRSSSISRWRSSDASADLSIPSVLGAIELTLDPGANVARPVDLRQALVKHELGDAGGGRHFRLQDIGLARKQHASGALARTDLIG